MSIIASAVKHLIAAGVTGDALIEAIADMEASSGPILSKRQARNKRYYETHKTDGKRLKASETSDQDGDALSSSPIPLDPPSQTHPPIIPQTLSPNPETKRAKRLSTDWVLPASWGRWAQGNGYSEAIIRLEAEKFANHWHSKAGKDATKLDWEKTWKNWMLNVPKSRNLGTPSPKPKSEFMQHQDDVQRELDKALGRKRDDEFTGNTLDLETGNWRAH